MNEDNFRNGSAKVAEVEHFGPELFQFGYMIWRPLCVIAGIVLLFLLFAAPGAHAQSKVYEKPSDFIRGAFPGGVPAAQSVTLSSSMAKEVRGILGHNYIGGTRITFWKSGARTAWILEEIGKTQPITTGIIVDGGAITSVQVLIYRESHGWEVERPFFTRQFKGAKLAGGGKLTKRIDGIAGATLSVRSLTRLAAMALYLDAAIAP